MVKHIVMWRLKDSAKGNDKTGNARLVKQKLESMRGAIPGMLRIEVGLDIGASPDSSDVVLYSEFDSREALEAYQSHPAHVAFKDFIKEVRVERRVVDYET